VPEPDSDSPAPRPARLHHYAIAVAAAVLATALRMGLAGYVVAPFILAYPAVMLAATVGGLGPGILATLLAAGMAWYWLLPPSGRYQAPSLQDGVGLLLFTLMGVFMSVVAELYHRSRRRVGELEARRAAQEAESRFKTYVEAAPVGIYVLGDGGRFVEANPAGLEFLGADPGTLTSRTILDFLDEEGREVATRDMATLTVGDQRDRDYHIVRADGRRVWGIVRSVKLGDHGYLAFSQDVTERKAAADALRESEQRLALVLDGSFDGYWDTDLATGTSRVSTRWNEIMGREPGLQTIRQEEWAALVHPEDRLASAPHVSGVMERRGDRLDVEYRVQRTDGAQRWVRSRGKVVSRDDAGRPLRVAGALTDVTEQKRAEALLREERNLLRISFDTPLVGIVVFTPEGEWLFVNDCVCAMAGCTREEFLKRHFTDFTRPDEVARDWDLLRRLQSGTEDRDTRERRFVRKDGTEFWASVSLHCVRSPADQVTHLVAFVKDISPLKAAEEALLASEARFRSLAEESPVGVFETDAVGNNVYLNRAAQEITGQAPGEAHGPGWRNAIAPEDRETVAREWQAAVSAGRIFENEAWFEMPDGSRKRVQGCASALRDAGGAVTGFIGVLIDVTQQRALQAQLAVASRLASMGTLVTGVAHEINNPLASAMAGHHLALEDLRDLLERVRRGEPVEREPLERQLEEVVDSLADAETGDRRIARIVKDLATFGRPDPRRSRIRLIDAVDQAMHWLPGSVASSATVQVEHGEAPEILASVGQLGQVVVNLVTNAAKAIPDGRRGTVTVRVGTGAPGMARLEVADDGVGMPPAVMERMFDPFFSTREVGQGTGLGLPVCHSIVTAHGGTITAASEVGRGTTFRVELPAAPAEE
jgi:two-component system, NtrC family, sensor kinase